MGVTAGTSKLSLDAKKVPEVRRENNQPWTENINLNPKEGDEGYEKKIPKQAVGHEEQKRS